jgi:gamma-glutamyltranspeptidase/glutathione hydrolase
MRFRFFAVLSLVLVVVHLPNVYTSPLELLDRDLDGRDASHRGIGPGKLGAVASENSICSRHGTDILEKGGNAADGVSLLPHYMDAFFSHGW